MDGWRVIAIQTGQILKCPFSVGVLPPWHCTISVSPGLICPFLFRRWEDLRFKIKDLLRSKFLPVSRSLNFRASWKDVARYWWLNIPRHFICCCSSLLYHRLHSILLTLYSMSDACAELQGWVLVWFLAVPLIVPLLLMITFLPPPFLLRLLLAVTHPLRLFLALCLVFTRFWCIFLRDLLLLTPLFGHRPWFDFVLFPDALLSFAIAILVGDWGATVLVTKALVGATIVAPLLRLLFPRGCLLLVPWSTDGVAALLEDSLLETPWLFAVGNWTQNTAIDVERRTLWKKQNKLI